MMRHMCLSIQGALAKPDRKLPPFTDDEGRPYAAIAVRKYLREQLALGRSVLPLGACDAFDFQTGCRGHGDGVGQ